MMAQGVKLTFDYYGMVAELALTPKAGQKSNDKPAPKRRGRPPLKKVA